MADNYLQFSETLDNLTEPEKQWLLSQLESIVVSGGKTFSFDELPDGVNDDDVTFRGPRFLADAKQIDTWGGEPDFCWSFGDEGEHFRRGRHLWLYSEDYGSVDQVAWLVRKFLRTFRPNDIWTPTYAATCSKPRVGEFGGGAVIVTAKRITWHDSGNLVHRALQVHQRRAQSSAERARRSV